jgi:hypothetical protein
MWRLDDGDASVARPEAVSVSYIQADRWLSAEEKVDNVPLQDDLSDWLRLFINAHFKVDEPRRQRAQSFLSGEEREKLARDVKNEPRHG